MAQCFRDAAGRLWEVVLTVGHAKRVLRLTGVDLLRPGEGSPPLYQRLAADPVLVCDVLYAALRPELDAGGLSDRDFGAALTGEAVLAAWAAFNEAWLGFLPEPNLPAAGDATTGSTERRAAEPCDPWRIVHELAAAAQCDPDPRTVRELDWMAAGRLREEWRQTSQLLAVLINAHRGEAARPVYPNQLNPFLPDEERSPPRPKRRIGVEALANEMGLGPPARPAPQGHAIPADREPNAICPHGDDGSDAARRQLSS